MPRNTVDLLHEALARLNSATGTLLILHHYAHHDLEDLVVVRADIVEALSLIDRTMERSTSSTANGGNVHADN